MKRLILLSIIFVVLVVVTVSMPASAQQEGQLNQGKIRTLGVLLFPGFELLDAYGPMELWGNLRNKVQIVTIATNRGEIASSQGPKTIADYGYNDAPHLDLILVPGGMGILQFLKDTATLEWLRESRESRDCHVSLQWCFATGRRWYPRWPFCNDQ